MPTVLYPGSFDPLHLGHLDIIEQAAELFGRVIVVIMHNREKPSGLFPVDERITLVHASVAELDGQDGLVERVAVIAHSGLAVDAARESGADFIVKGLRTPADFEIEQQMALTNYSVSGIRTVYLPCRLDRGFISSRFLREIARYGRSVGHMVPGPVDEALTRMFPPDKAMP
jgi:pantetheine-phosphate adenylyltransferase